METIEERLGLLIESQQLRERPAQTTRVVLGLVEERLGAPLGGDSAVMFVTHIALAFQRLEQGETIDAGLPEAMLAEVRSRTDDWQLAERIARITEQDLGARLPPGEIGYIAAHLAALSEEQHVGEAP
jgi:transcriptional antiterminator